MLLFSNNKYALKIKEILVKFLQNPRKQIHIKASKKSEKHSFLYCFLCYQRSKFKHFTVNLVDNERTKSNNRIYYQVLRSVCHNRKKKKSPHTYGHHHEFPVMM